MNAYRSMLFTPATRPDRVRKVPDIGADAVIIDLEDSVPADRRPEARAMMPELIGELGQQEIGVYVRTSGWATGHLLADLESVVVRGLDGIALPKVDGPEHVAALDMVLTELEQSRGLPVGGTAIFPLPETAHGMLSSFALCKASARVKMGLASSSPRGDVARAIGWQWTREGMESLYIRSKAVAETRAAGVDQVLGGIVVLLDDEDFLKSWTRHCRAVGCTGMIAIHPSHIEEINRVFTPSQEDIEVALDILKVMDAALKDGVAATRSGGQMVDYAHVKTATALLARAEGYGVTVPDYPRLEVRPPGSTSGSPEC